MSRPVHNSAFTLIEVLIVIAIIAILSIVVILVLNPAQLLQQARDSNRVSDMSTLTTALGIYLAQGGSSLGNANTVYVSIPDPMATTTAGDQCQGLGLLSLPANYTYHCAATSTYRAVDSTGWAPVNFASISTGAPLGQLPIDPINTSSSREYYTYETNGTQYEVTMVPESQKYQLGGSNDVISNDGGVLASVYEKGNVTGLEPLDYGDPTLVGYWPLDEGTGTVAYDNSGNNATGSWSGTQIGSNGTYYTQGKGRGYTYAGDFDGSTDYVDCGSNISAFKFSTTGSFSISAWFYLNSVTGSYQTIVSYSRDSNPYYGLWISSSPGYISFIGDGALSGQSASPNQWYQIVGVQTGGSKYLYVNGVLVTSTSATTAGGSGTCEIGNDTFGEDFSGLIDDIRIYSRALSASEIASMYAGHK